ncbi:MAG TPA: phosphomannomutase CpsG [Thermodesulfovibrionales bacterium]|nr:phosphomannomutase CpsG [Thermodesulfovibrionales bacterium]
MNCFKAYDIRGRVPDELNPDIAYRIGRAYAEFIKPADVVVGRDIRHSGKELSIALVKGLVDSGVVVSDIGICGTEEVYFATFSKQMGGGIMITASHNPADYNGMKLVRQGSMPVSGDTGLGRIKELAERNAFGRSAAKGKVLGLYHRDEYIRHLLGYVDAKRLKPLRIVVNAGNGCAGPVIDLLEERLPFTFIKINHAPDGNFPAGIPNPLLPENREATADAVKKEKADLGIAWDGDFDRCFLFDEQGRFIEGYYIVGLLAKAMLARNPGARIIHDPRLTWNTIDMVKKAGGVPVESKTGHAFIKERMRAEDAVYGGEMSAHHYFRDFAYCDSGMIPWLLVSEIMSGSGRNLSELVSERMAMFPASGEINRALKDPATAISSVENAFVERALMTDYTDGLSMEFETWRFNLRSSNTEPVVRLNVESRGDDALMRAMTFDILSILDSFA